MATDVSVRNATLKIEDTERKKLLGQPEPVKSGLVVFDPSAEDTGNVDTLPEELDTEPPPHS